MLNLLAFALLQLATLLASPNANKPAPTTSAETSFSTSTPTPAPTPPTGIGSEGWDND